jgi:hypothetical protein
MALNRNILLGKRLKNNKVSVSLMDALNWSAWFYRTASSISTIWPEKKLGEINLE